MNQTRYQSQDLEIKKIYQDERQYIVLESRNVNVIYNWRKKKIYKNRKKMKTTKKLKNIKKKSTKKTTKKLKIKFRCN